MKKKYTILSILLWGWVVVSAQSYQIGDLYTAPDGNKGIVYYLHPDGSGGWVVALNDASTGCAWGDATDVPGLTNQSSYNYQNLLNDTAGYANTQTLRSYQNNSTTYAAGQVDFAHGWVLPSPAQLSVLYGQLPFVASAITGAGGTALAYTNYWCSAEYSASNAWCVEFGTNYNSGYFYYVSKSTSCHVRAVRSFSNSSVTYDTSLTYQWNTGSTQPYINVNPAQTSTYTVTATTDYGCSNTAEQTVIVGTGVAQTIYDTVCRGADYEANGFTLSAAETQTAGTLTRSRTLETAGCSSTLTLQLRVNEPAASTISATACGSYTWNGVTYYASGDYIQTFSSANGCDSVVTLHLTVSVLPDATITVTDDTICAGDAVTLVATLLNEGDLMLVPPVSIGDILCTDNTIEKPTDWPVAGKTAKAVVFYVDGTGKHGWATNLHDEGTSIPWGAYGTNIYTLSNYSTARSAISDFDGYSNTLKIRAAVPYDAAVAAYTIDFGNGWYLPAAGQLRLLLAELTTLNASLQLVNGTQFPMDTYFWYWSSSQYSQYNAWHIRSDGYTSNGGKDYGRRVRSVRTF